ncbi:hypothetical protein PLICRDRAFT_35225 [Plicaturopsis crispa FD-325 SS-3]|nr:hypothetical protein PLICRDRAFT_35225 [Plicaturopsis crispa FD-325 SS-3]
MYVARDLPVHIRRGRTTIAHHNEGFLSIPNEPQLPTTTWTHSTDPHHRLMREWDVTWCCCRRWVRCTPKQRTILQEYHVYDLSNEFPRVRSSAMRC